MHVTTRYFFFFFNDTAPPEIYPLSLHDALPICLSSTMGRPSSPPVTTSASRGMAPRNGTPTCRLIRSPPPRRKISVLFPQDRKSTRLNSSHGYISYAVFCLKKKTKKTRTYVCNS